MSSSGSRGIVVVLAAAVLAAGCSGGGGVAGTESTTTAPPTTTTTTTTTRPPPVLCAATRYHEARTGDDTEVRRFPVGGQETAAAQFAMDTYECAADVIVVDPADLERAALAAALAAGLQAPLLFSGPAPNPAVEAVVAALRPQRVWLAGEVALPTPPEGTAVEGLSGDPATLAGEVKDLVGGAPAVTLPAAGGAGLVAVAVRAMVDGTALEPSPPVTTTTTASSSASTTSSTTSTTGAWEEPPPAEEVFPIVVAGTGERGVAWLVDAAQSELALAAAAAAVHSGGLMALVDGEDLRRVPEVGRALRSAPGGNLLVYLVGQVTGDAFWQLPLLLEGDELPGGGYLLFPGRRLVALYGHSWAPELGVLAEQSPVEAAALAATLAADHAEEGVAVVPAFEIIATVADSRAGDDGNYSNESPLDDLRPWIEAAGDAGLYVLLDLQPGRTDFLTQARLYEEFLRLPYVGLALDPEWRLGPDEVHLVQFGNVSAAEVNAVAEWLAGLVREAHLPQKMLLLHQFRLAMIPDREEIVVPRELALVIQMDGQGALADKYATWAAVTAGTEGRGWSWGWKNFYDEDAPMATPAQVLELEPWVAYVSFQ